MRKKGASEELRVGRSSVADEQTISHRTHTNIAGCRPQPTSQVNKPLDAAKTTKRANSAGAQEETKPLHSSSFETSRDGARKRRKVCGWRAIDLLLLTSKIACAQKIGNKSLNRCGNDGGCGRQENKFNNEDKVELAQKK